LAAVEGEGIHFIYIKLIWTSSSWGLCLL